MRDVLDLSFAAITTGRFSTRFGSISVPMEGGVQVQGLVVSRVFA
jgi:hypothetical protein